MTSKKKVNNSVEVLFFLKMLSFLFQCGFGRGKQLINCGKSSSKYFQEFILGILICVESLKTWPRKRQMIQLFSTDFLKI